MQENNVDLNFLKYDPKKVETFVYALVPTNITEVKSVMGMLSFYSSFLNNFAIIAAPPYDLTKKMLSLFGQIKLRKLLKLLKEKLLTK